MIQWNADGKTEDTDHLLAVVRHLEMPAMHLAKYVGQPRDLVEAEVVLQRMRRRANEQELD